ncbi:MAG: hypothetical protein ACOYN3_01840 [Acidimicrobiia bacterium]
MLRKSLLALVASSLLVLGGCSVAGSKSGSSSAFCTEVKKIYDTQNSLFPRDATDSENFKNALAKLKEIQKKAPGSVKADLGTMIEALEKLQSGDLKGLADPAFSAKVQKASENLQDYNTKTCKLVTTTTQ